MSETEPNPLLIFATLASIIAGVVAFYFLQQKRKAAPVLSPTDFKKFPLIEKKRINHNTCIYKFGLPRATDRLGLPIGQHISIAANINGKEIVRSYTPVSNDNQLGSFDLLIKVYEQGNVTKHIDSKKIGETIDVRGPKGFFQYTPNMTKKFGMIAGGTGITPMFQIINAVLSNPDDKTQLYLVYANVTESDILLQDELDKLQAAHPDQLFIHYVLNTPPETWAGSVGFVTSEIMQHHLPPPDKESTLLICGPPPMVSALKKAAVEIGYEKAKPVSKHGDQVFVF